MDDLAGLGLPLDGDLGDFSLELPSDLGSLSLPLDAGSGGASAASSTCTAGSMVSSNGPDMECGITTSSGSSSSSGGSHSDLSFARPPPPPPSSSSSSFSAEGDLSRALTLYNGGDTGDGDVNMSYGDGAGFSHDPTQPPGALATLADGRARMAGASLVLREGAGAGEAYPLYIVQCTGCGRWHTSFEACKACFGSHLCPHKCFHAQCTRRFRSVQEALHHFELEHGSEQRPGLYCAQCGQQPATAAEFEEHRKKHAEEVSALPVVWECPWCDARHMQADDYLDHLRAHRKVSVDVRSVLRFDSRVSDAELSEDLRLARLAQQQRRERRVAMADEESVSRHRPRHRKHSHKHRPSRKRPFDETASSSAPASVSASASSPPSSRALVVMRPPEGEHDADVPLSRRTAATPPPPPPHPEAAPLSLDEFALPGLPPPPPPLGAAARHVSAGSNNGAETGTKNVSSSRHARNQEPTSDRESSDDDDDEDSDGDDAPRTGKASHKQRSKHHRTSKRRKRVKEPRRILCTACLKILARKKWAEKHANSCVDYKKGIARGERHRINQFETSEDAKKFQERLEECRKLQQDIAHLLDTLPENQYLSLKELRIKQQEALERQPHGVCNGNGSRSVRAPNSVL